MTVLGVDDRPRAGACAHPVGGAGMIAVGEDDPGHALADEGVHVVLSRFDGVDTDVAAGIADEVAVEVVAVGFGKPRPRENIADDVPHARLHFSPRPRTKLTYSTERRKTRLSDNGIGGWNG